MLYKFDNNTIINTEHLLCAYIIASGDCFKVHFQFNGYSLKSESDTKLEILEAKLNDLANATWDA